ncbi:DUF4862 family protein [Plantibacter flavus]|uniref:DUF4862 family protein n=1 Tax=Plantibacter flavus TaxID=150123 RepID=UPI003F17995D
MTPSVGTNGILVSAYAASPAHTAWDPALEAEVLPALCALPGVVGLEVPWLGSVHPHDDEWFLEHVPAGARLALTALPFVMRRNAAGAGYGIASPDADGRAAAVADLRALAADLHLLNDRSRAEVAVVALHTAPHASGSGDALLRSLDELGAVDWDDARLVIEHCDAAVPGRRYEKGFLSVEDELAAVAASAAVDGLWMNWGRSAIELQGADAVSAQIASVADSGALVGLTLSGAAAVDGPYGTAWADAHLPIREADPTSESLLDTDRVRDAIVAAGSVPWLGLKVSRRPTDRTAQDVVRTVAHNLALACSQR